MIALWLSTAAMAQTLVWDWPAGTERVWYIQAGVAYSNPIWLRSKDNVEGRVERIYTEFVWRCRAGEPDRNGWELACRIDDARLLADPLPTERDAVAALLPELEAGLIGATVQLQLDRNGHLRAVDLEGLPKDNRRSGAIHETLRLLVARNAAGFDLHLPSNGDLQKSWKQRDDLVYAYPISYGSLSGARVMHTLGDANERYVQIRSVGSGTVRVGEPVVDPTSPSGTQEPWMLDLNSEAQALFDGGEGHLVARRWVAVGRPIASSGWQVGLGVEPYVQTGVLSLLPSEAPPMTLAPSGLWSVDTPPGAAWHHLLASPLWKAPTTP